ncbi:MAG: OsmC family protein, partial [candidate division NC10 bacterium]|nr:OsmC family protein [candidate division NC10 bacterium]
MGETLNGIDLEGFREALELIKADPEKVKAAPRSARIRWLGGFKMKVYTRDHVYIVDEPHRLASTDEAPTAVEYVVGALGACLATGFILNATMHGIEIYNMEVALEGEMENILMFFGLSEEGHPGFKEISAKLYVTADADREVLEELWERT